MKSPINRRKFIQQAGTVSVGLTLASYLSPRKLFGQAAPSANVSGSNDSLRVAVMGTNGRGLAHVECLKLPNVSVAAICDVDDRAIVKGQKEAVKQGMPEPKGFKDFRKV